MITNSAQEAIKYNLNTSSKYIFHSAQCVPRKYIHHVIIHIFRRYAHFYMNILCNIIFGGIFIDVKYSSRVLCYSVCPARVDDLLFARSRRGFARPNVMPKAEYSFATRKLFDWLWDYMAKNRVPYTKRTPSYNHQKYVKIIKY